MRERRLSGFAPSSLRFVSGLVLGLRSGGGVPCPDTGNGIVKYGDFFRVFFLMESNAIKKCEEVVSTVQKTYNRRIQPSKM